MQWQKLKGIISSLSNIFHVTLSPQSTKKQQKKSLTMTACLTLQPQPPPVQLFVLNHFLFSSPGKSQCSRWGYTVHSVPPLTPSKLQKTQKKGGVCSSLNKSTKCKDQKKITTRQKRVLSLNLLKHREYHINSPPPPSLPEEFYLLWAQFALNRIVTWGKTIVTWGKVLFCHLRENSCHLRQKSCAVT